MDTTLALDNDSFILGVPFVKIDKESRIVEGFATLDNVDKAGDILDFDASREAFAKWPGNIREMHEKKAVGRAVNFTEKDYKADDGGTYRGIWLKARISKGAEDTWQKVLDGTLSGFSVGGAIQEKLREMRKGADGEQPVWRVVKYSLGEVSLVDNPCNGLANVALVKFADGSLRMEEILDDLELEKATNMSAGAVNNARPPVKATKPMAQQDPNMQQEPEAQDTDVPMIQAVIKALTAWRDSESEEGDDHDIAFISSLIQQIKERVYNGDPGEHGSNDAIFGQDTKEPAKPTKTVKKSEPMEEDMDNLLNKEITDISNVEGLTDEHKGIIRKFIDFLTKDTTSEEQVEKEEGEPEMDEKLVKEAIESAVDTVSKSAEDKFTQIGESLTNVAAALEKLATVETLDEIKNSIEAAVTALADRVKTLEESGAVQKSADETGEKLEKSDEKKGFWASALVPEYIQNRVSAGR